MKTNGLMLGDWVLAHRSVNPYNDGVPCKEWKQAGQIQKIEYGFVDVKFTECSDAPTDEENCVVEEFNQKEIEPIPLTSEILEKNGFVYSDIPFWQSWQQFGLSIYGTTENYHINCGMNVSMNVSNVHELQHALKLCCIEKKIEL